MYNTVLSFVNDGIFIKNNLARHLLMVFKLRLSVNDRSQHIVVGSFFKNKDYTYKSLF